MHAIDIHINKYIIHRARCKIFNERPIIVQSKERLAGYCYLKHDNNQ